MSTLLKDIYSTEFYNKFSEVLAAEIPGFDKNKFKRQIFDSSWKNKELKARMKHTTLVLNAHFPSDFKKTAKLIQKIIENLRKRKITESSLEFMFLPDYIETYGINHLETSVKTFEFVTQFTSCEFAVRPFIKEYGNKMIQQMQKWSLHKSHHVRRLASEGSRSRLPWAMALPELKKNPAPILPLLENLKRDASEYVRRSVANNLNDISKDNPDIVLSIAKKWNGHSKETDDIIKHGSRTLLKQGHPKILKFYKLTNDPGIEIYSFKIHKSKITIGESLNFSFTIKYMGKKEAMVRLEYAIHYLRNSGERSKKVFKISECKLYPEDTKVIARKKSFEIITTRKFYPGTQQLSLIVNGRERAIISFELKM